MDKHTRARWWSVLFIVTLSIVTGSVIGLPRAALAASVDVWWPTDGAHVKNVQPFKALVQGMDVSRYDMFWQVDGGTWNWMDNNDTSYQHKEADVNLAGWTWHGSGPYVVNFIARQSGTVIAQRSVTIYIDNGQSTNASAPQVQAQQPSQPTVIAATPSVATPVNTLANTAIAGVTYYVNPNSSAAQQALAWQSSDTQGVAAMRILAAQPTASWFGDSSTIQQDVASVVQAATQAGTQAVLVAYNIPQRDCGSFSAGGSNNPDGYRRWVNAFAAGIGGAKATVIVEPDALAEISCLSATDQQTRKQLLSYAVDALKHNPLAHVYLDAGHSNWIDPATMAANLTAAGIAHADGFSLNVSNFMSTNSEIQYGTQISSLTGGKHFVIDTSRNGNGSNGEWCNPQGRAIGTKPTTQTGNSLVDTYLWIKVPGESDGACNGGPNAGVWWPEYAKALVQNAH